MNREEQIERIQRIKSNRSWYEKKGIDVNKLIEAEEEMLHILTDPVQH